jgi:hypothetical protein
MSIPLFHTSIGAAKAEARKLVHPDKTLYPQKHTLHIWKANVESLKAMEDAGMIPPGESQKDLYMVADAHWKEHMQHNGHELVDSLDL